MVHLTRVLILSTELRMSTTTINMLADQARARENIKKLTTTTIMGEKTIPTQILINIRESIRNLFQTNSLVRFATFYVIPFIDGESILIPVL